MLLTMGKWQMADPDWNTKLRAWREELEDLPINLKLDELHRRYERELTNLELTG